MKRRTFVFELILFAFALPACRGQEPYEAEAQRLAVLLDWKAGSVVAEIGAGEGQMTLIAARRVGPTGQVFTTELDAKKLAHLRELAAKEKNIRVVEAGVAETNLPPDCCDSIFMRRVYHHFTEPAQIDASLFRAVKPGGRLAVIDFPPRKWLSRVGGVPKNRDGHGIPQKVLTDELTAAGFQVELVPANWADDDYCVVFHKPAQ